MWAACARRRWQSTNDLFFWQSQSSAVKWCKHLMCCDGTCIFHAQQLSRRVSCLTCLQFDEDAGWAPSCSASKRASGKGALPPRAHPTVLLEVLGVELRKTQWTHSPKGLSTPLDSESFQNTISKFQYHFKIPMLFQNADIISKYQYHFKIPVSFQKYLHHARPLSEDFSHSFPFTYSREDFLFFSLLLIALLCC